MRADLGGGWTPYCGGEAAAIASSRDGGAALSDSSTAARRVLAAPASRIDRIAAGRAARERLPRTELAVWDPATRRDDAVSIVLGQNASRLASVSQPRATGSNRQAAHPGGKRHLRGLDERPAAEFLRQAVPGHESDPGRTADSALSRSVRRTMWCGPRPSTRPHRRSDRH